MVRASGERPLLCAPGHQRIGRREYLDQVLAAHVHGCGAELAQQGVRSLGCQGADVELGERRAVAPEGIELVFEDVGLQRRLR
jgi:hypothetical protein